jgi:cysteine desulfurase/selenocysteine lyase
MSTPDLSDVNVLVVPGEARPAVGHAPAPTHATGVPTGGPTPGLATAILRVPGAPTVPEFDPVSVAVLIQKLANEPTPLSPSPPAGERGDASVPQNPVQAGSLALPSTLPTSTGIPNPTSTSPMVPSTTEASNPFMSAPQFDSVLPSEAFSIPLVELSSPVHTAEPTVPTKAPASAPHPGPLPADAGRGSPQFDPTGHGYTHASHGQFDPYAIKSEFPILHQQVNGRQLVWFDNAATTQKPRAVIDRLSKFYERENSNIHRAAHTLAARATDAYEGARETVRKFLNAPSTKDLIFVRGATEGINLVAQAWGRRNIKEGDEIVVTHLEHHANIVPWQMLVAEKGAKLRVAPVDDRGQIILEEYEKLLNPRTRLVSFTMVSNALGTITPAKQMVELAHRHGARVLVDGAQSVSHLRVDLQSLDPDFFVFSGHKVFAPTGIGVVYGKTEVLEAMPPWQGGGNMISDVTFEKTTFHPPPMRFEAGTGNIADAVGLGAALDWVMRVGLENIAAYEHELLEYATECLGEVPGLTLYGTAPEKAGVLSFTLEGQKTEQVGALLDREGIAVRSGHHCAQPILRRFGLEATVRASLAPYNTREDVDALVAALKRIQEGRR